MRKKNMLPDARSYGSIADAWEKLGNRKMMLNTVLDFQDAEKNGKLGEALRPEDAGLPYYSLARSYMNVGDARRSMAVLKTVRDKGIPLTVEAYRIRLENFLKVPGPQRDAEQIERAFVDALRNKPGNEPLFSEVTRERLCRALGRGDLEKGSELYFQILDEIGIDESEIVLPMEADPIEVQRWKTDGLRSAMKRRFTGKSLILKPEDEDAKMRWRFYSRSRPEVEPITVGGYRRVPTTKEGFPEWMRTRKPILWGKIKG